MFAVFTIVQSINTRPSPSPHHLVVISWIHISFCTKQIMIESKPESSSSFWQSDQLFRKPGPANVYDGNFYLCAGMCIILLSPIRGVRRGWHTNTIPAPSSVTGACTNNTTRRGREGAAYMKTQSGENTT